MPTMRQKKRDEIENELQQSFVIKKSFSVCMNSEPKGGRTAVPAL